jgi:hypothetical protein
MKEFSLDKTTKLENYLDFLQSQDPFPILSGFLLIGHFMIKFAPDKTGHLTDLMQSQGSLGQPEPFSISSCFLPRPFHV